MERDFRSDDWRAGYSKGVEHTILSYRKAETDPLRDQFAMAAMQALVSDPLTRGVSEKAAAIAATSYAVADAMMVERQAKRE